jgi:hypothetical protein
MDSLFGGIQSSINDKGSHINAMYQALKIIALSLSQDSNTSLEDIVTKLRQNSVLSPNLLSKDPVHFVFDAVGWLTMLFDPVPIPLTERLQLLPIIGGKGVALGTETYLTYSRDLHDSRTLPIHYLLREFGNILPQPQFASSTLSTGTRRAPATSKILMLSHLNYYTLSRVAKIRIEWVDCLSLHLEFDSSNGVLKIFRFPSFCRIVCSGTLKVTYLSRQVHHYHSQLSLFFPITHL